MDVLAQLRASDPDAPWLGSVADAFARFTAVQALVWLRRAAVKWKLGDSVVRAPGAASALEAIALQARDPGSTTTKAIRFLPASAVLVDEERLEILICPERLTSSDIEELAAKRAQRVVQSLGPRDDLSLLLAASSVRGPKPDHMAAVDVVDPDAPIDDIIGGARRVSAWLTYADDVLAAA